MAVEFKCNGLGQCWWRKCTCDDRQPGVKCNGKCAGVNVQDPCTSGCVLSACLECGKLLPERIHMYHNGCCSQCELKRMIEHGKRIYWQNRLKKMYAAHIASKLKPRDYTNADMDSPQDNWLDEKRMCAARDSLDEILIAPIISMIVDYARYSEAELVHAVLMSVGEDMFFGTFQTKKDEYDDVEWFCVYTNPPDEATALDYDISGWKPGDQYEFDLAFFGRYDAYEPTIKIGLDDLLPSRGLNVKVPADVNHILEECRDRYLLKMWSCMAEI